MSSPPASGYKPLSIQYLALFSHVQSPNVTVADCISENGWAIRFRHITSRRAEEELGVLLDKLDLITLNDDRDVRVMRFGPDKNFSVKSCYYALNFGGVLCAGNQKKWNSFAPKKCKNSLGWHYMIALTRRKYLPGEERPRF
jgi:hypothetical protein